MLTPSCQSFIRYCHVSWMPVFSAGLTLGRCNVTSSGTSLIYHGDVAHMPQLDWYNTVESIKDTVIGELALHIGDHVPEADDGNNTLKCRVSCQPLDPCWKTSQYHLLGRG